MIYTERKPREKDVTTMKSIVLGSAAALAAMPALAHNEAAFGSAAEHQMAHLHAVGGWEILAIVIGLGFAAALPSSRAAMKSALRAITGGNR